MPAVFENAESVYAPNGCVFGQNEIFQLLLDAYTQKTFRKQNSMNIKCDAHIACCACKNAVFMNQPEGCFSFA